MSAPSRSEREARAADREARLVAQTEFVRPVVIEAGAGTGKTAALVARVVVWALGPGWERARVEEPGAEAERVAARVLRRIVAITFTEAAAAEMDERVAEALGKIEAGEALIGLFDEALTGPAEERAGRARALRSVLDQMRVHTIHAFCRRLLAESPLEAGLHPQFEVDADESRQKAVVREVLEAALPELFTSEAMLALAADGVQASALEEALLLLLREGAPLAALARDPLEDAAVAALFADLLEPLSAFVALEQGRLAGLAGAKKVSETAHRLAALRDRIASVVRPDAAALEALLAALGETGPDVATIRKWSRSDFGKKGAAVLGDDETALAERAGRLHPILQHLEKLDLPLLAAAREVLEPLYGQVLERLRAAGVATFPSLLRDARALLRDQPAVLRRVRGQVDQLMVDEFQDTDPVQCDVVRRIALEGPEPERPGLFLVGDPKQSIYGWRSADLEAYDGFCDEVRAHGGRVLSLVVNHRSAPPILDEVSRVIAPVMSPEHGLQPAYQPLVASEERAGDEGFAEHGCAPVEHWISCERDAEAGAPVETTSDDASRVEARAVAEEIGRLHAGGEPWSHFGMLFRATTGLETYLEELRRAGVPFAVEGDRSYFQRREIIEAGALVRCVLDPNDQLALLTVLRSPVVGVPDAALIPLWARALPDRMAALHGEEADWSGLEAAVQAAATDVPADVPGIDRVAGWAGNLLTGARTLALLRAAFEDDPADVFVEKLRALFFLEATEASRYLGAYRLANLDRFFRDLLGTLEEGEGDPQAILRSLREDVAERREHEEGRPREALSDAVQISTIHKAKGLAFEHVYLLQLHRGRGSRSEARVDERDDGRWEYELLGARTPGYHRVLSWRARVEAAEQVRTLYVAATRARRRLVFAGLAEGVAKRGPGEGSHAALLASRAGGRPDAAELMTRLASEGQGAAADLHEVRWVFPALAAAAAPAGPEARRARLEVGSVRAMARALARRRAAADREMERPRVVPISALAHEVAREAFEEEADQDELPENVPAPAPRAGRDVASAVGTAVHALPAADRERARAWADEVLARFRKGPLFDRWCALAPHVVSREFPVLLPPAGGEAALRSGVVDLLYQDPETGGMVVADYKTDRIDDEGALAAQVARYGPQGAGYVQAVQEALGLTEPPRFELWFLFLGRVCPV